MTIRSARALGAHLNGIETFPFFAADSLAARPSCWIPAAARSMNRSRSDGAGAISGR
jgi:uncharacterized MAPEG superfamily protein